MLTMEQSVHRVAAIWLEHHPWGEVIESGCRVPVRSATTNAMWRVPAHVPVATPRGNATAEARLVQGEAETKIMAAVRARPSDESHLIAADDSDFIMMSLCLPAALNISFASPSQAQFVHIPQVRAWLMANQRAALRADQQGKTMPRLVKLQPKTLAMEAQRLQQSATPSELNFVQTVCRVRCHGHAPVH